MRKRSAGFNNPEGLFAIGCLAVVSAILVPVVWKAAEKAGSPLGWIGKLISIVAVVLVVALGFAAWAGALNLYERWSERRKK